MFPISGTLQFLGIEFRNKCFGNYLQGDVPYSEM